MTTKRSRSPRFDDATIRACGDLLRVLDSSGRLRANALIARMPQGMDREAVARVVEAVLGALTPRQRDIVVRCDVKGEGYAAVANALHVSERHMFRERRAALGKIAQTLLSHEQQTHPPEITVARDAIEARMAMSAALENGAWQAAADMLEQLAAELPREDRGPVEIRLVRLYRDADRFAQAYHHAETARALAARAPAGQGWQQAEADVAVAAVAACAGNWEVADGLAARALTQLRPFADRSAGARIQNAFVAGLAIRAELAGSRGADEAFAFASEACSIVDRSAVDRRVAIWARSVAATSSILRARDIQRSEQTLWDCYYGALRDGLTRDALMVAASLSTHYRLSGRPAEALRFLAPLADAAGTAGTGWVRVGVFSELVYASLATGAVGQAAAYLETLSEYAAGNRMSLAEAELARAKLRLARGEFASALGAAMAAEAEYARIGHAPLIGTSLRMQAEALAALGQHDRALRAITLAIDMLKETSHRVRLANAYHVMARITRRPQYEVTARRLEREASVHR